MIKQQNKYNIQSKDNIAEYRELNNDERNQYKWNQQNTNPIYRLIDNNRNRIRDALKSNSKATDKIELLGCNKECFLLVY